MCGRRREWSFKIPDNQLVSSIVEDDVAFGPENLGIEPQEIRKRVDQALESVNMGKYKKKAPHLLSGGQKQRIAIAGVVAMKPECIIFDEPTAMLDPKGRDEIMQIISELHEEGITVILITHFMDEAVRAERVIIMNEGTILLDGSPSEVFSKGETIKEANLDVPLAVELAGRLRKRGIKIPQNNHKRRIGGIRMSIQVRNLSHIYSKGMPDEQLALSNINFDIYDGEIVGVIGHTGSGKSTLLQHLNGL